MLPAALRMRSPKQFEQTVKHGVRVGRPSLVVHAHRDVVSPVRNGSRASVADRTDGADVRVGFVVSKRVGNAVARNRVKRRLRHLARGEVAGTPAGTRVVVRALPDAAEHPERVAGDLSWAWRRSMDRLARRMERGQ